MIISASRRCDIPSYFGEWFLNRLKDGYVLIQNPYNAHRLSRAALTPKSVDIIVFWTKNPTPFLKHLPEIDKMGYTYYFEFTITPYGKETERNLPDKEKLIDVFIELGKKLGKNRMVWRYDPIILDDTYDIEYHTQRFAHMAQRLCASTNRCVISFVDNYKNVAARMGKDPSCNMSLQNIHSVSERLSKIASEHGLKIYTCAEKYNLKKYGIEHGACVDKNIIEDILGAKINTEKDKNQRDECLCAESIDIGTYGCCTNGCSYCYALKSEASTLANMQKHSPLSPVLIGTVSPDAIITNRPDKSVLVSQLSLFD